MDFFWGGGRSQFLHPFALFLVATVRMRVLLCFLQWGDLSQGRGEAAAGKS